jgi:hypothetical protein
MSIAQQAVSGGLITYMQNREPEVARPAPLKKTFIEGRFKSERYVGDLNKLVNKLTPTRLSA